MTAAEKRHHRQSTLDWISMYRVLWRDYQAQVAYAKHLKRRLKRLGEWGAKMRDECEHGSLRRSCGRCSDAADLAELRAELLVWKNVIDDEHVENARLRAALEAVAHERDFVVRCNDHIQGVVAAALRIFKETEKRHGESRLKQMLRDEHSILGVCPFCGHQKNGALCQKAHP